MAQHLQQKEEEPIEIFLAELFTNTKSTTLVTAFQRIVARNTTLHFVTMSDQQEVNKSQPLLPIASFC
jgi:hypothetical protein